MKIKFDSRYLGIGLFWNNLYELKTLKDDGRYTQYYINIYLCIIPTLPIIFRIPTKKSWVHYYMKN